MKNTIKYFFTLSILLCSTSTYSKENDIQFKWKLTQIIASDTNTIKIKDGNFVKIDDAGILEMMKEYGNRYHPYHREGKILNVTSGGVTNKWEILLVDKHNLHLKTPIGTYILKR